MEFAKNFELALETGLLFKVDSTESLGDFHYPEPGDSRAYYLDLRF